MRAAVFLDGGFYADAGRERQAAIASNRDEPADDLLLGYAYERIRLDEHPLMPSRRAYV
jgi:hypothetical protein